MKSWPYPFWIAHRGAGDLAPENTLAALRLGAHYGFRMFECDVQLSADEEVFLLHDAALERTSTGRGLAGKLSWRQLSTLDAGSWHSSAYAGEPLARLDTVAHFCLANGYHLNIEIKPSPGMEYRTGAVVASELGRLWRGALAGKLPLLSSFNPEALRAVRAAAPQLPCGLLLDALWDGWFEKALSLECAALVCHYSLWDAATVARVHRANMRCLAYTVNDERVVPHLIALGIDGIITDRVDLFGGPAYAPV